MYDTCVRDMWGGGTYVYMTHVYVVADISDVCAWHIMCSVCGICICGVWVCVVSRLPNSSSYSDACPRGEGKGIRKFRCLLRAVD